MTMKCLIFFSKISTSQSPIPIWVWDSGSSCFQIGEMLKRLESALVGINIDIVLVYGDTNSTLAGALCANKCGLKLGHVEAGLRELRYYNA